jgi:hypothetical protein
MKDISFRPTKLIMALFEQIRKLDNLPNTDRNSIVERAMGIALKSKNLDWKFVSAITIDECFAGSIPKHIVLKVEEEKFNLINEQIKHVFSMEKITIPYTLKLLLVNYLSSLSQTNVPTSQFTVPNKIDLALFKNEYVQSPYRHKKRLLEACNVYLEAHPNLQQDLIEHAIHQQNQLTMFCDLSKYFPDKSTEFKTPTAIYIAKTLAGWFIFMVESQYDVSKWNDVLDHIVKSMENELQIKNESPFEKIRTKKNTETADYYKNVYASMISR